MTPTAEQQRTHLRRPPEIPIGLDAQMHRLHRLWRQRGCGHWRKEAMEALERAEAFRPLAAAALQEAAFAARSKLRRRSRIDANALVEALATLIETAHRQTGLRAHPEQVLGALALARGFFSEMQTGEGKTLVIGLAAALSGWETPSCHVLTANDYLAARDAEWLCGFYAACGLTVGCVVGEMSAPERTAGYAARVTYTTAKEAVADFLRDRLQLGDLARASRRLARSLTGAAACGGIVQRGLHHAIIDEADHALIDESVTPLIIAASRENAPLTAASQAAFALAGSLKRGADYKVDERTQHVELHAGAMEKLRDAATAFPGIWNGLGRRAELVTQALAARELFHRGKQYLIDDRKIMLIDESTGRVMPQRTWRQGLHQAVEAKEGIAITPPTETLARLSFQRYFRLYGHLAGITGTGREAAAECWQVYQLPFVRIPTHRPCIRERWPDRMFADEAAKWQAVAAEVARLHALGRPVLIGTRSVRASERLAELLRARGLRFSLLNAVHHREEAQTIAGAGEADCITVATNMAGRGADIKLGAGVAGRGGLHVLATERHESGRVDRQLFGRAGRQGDPGSGQAFVSLDDDLFLRFTPPWAKRAAAGLLRARVPGAELAAAQLTGHAQGAAAAAARLQRFHVLRTDSWLDETLAFTGGEA